ncbi:MAG: protein-glutamate O-methyltransferase CheR [Clostridiaceae bacterium]|nr:protein-glutamate O-methyltransferase CheR [Clostridiaceae bacterium]
MIEITQKEFDQLSRFIKDNYGIYLKNEKQTLVTGRLYHVLQSKNFNNFTEYFDYLVTDRTGEAVSTLLDKITTNHTFFMREADHFTYLREQVLPWMASVNRDHDLRTWCAACSTGEEPYTLAMIMDSFFGLEKDRWDTKILATDISSQALKTAQQGFYSNERILPLPAEWRSRYFKKIDDEQSALADRIKNQVIYRKFNLMEEHFPFKRKFHIIFCRNVMIYFDHETKDRLIEKFYDMTEPGGYLFIGHSESLNRDQTKYSYLKPAIYRKI